MIIIVFTLCLDCMRVLKMLAFSNFSFDFLVHSLKIFHRIFSTGLRIACFSGHDECSCVGIANLIRSANASVCCAMV